jgi:predicted transcriptional regulator
MSKKITISDAELEVLQELWNDTALTARQLTDRVLARTDWSEPTVKTLLLRLLQKRSPHKKIRMRRMYRRKRRQSSNLSQRLLRYAAKATGKRSDLKTAR